MYGSSYQRQRPSLTRLSPADTPITLILIAANVLTFLILYFARGMWLAQALALTLGNLRFPWTVVTWPLLGLGSAMGILFTSLWAWMIGGSLERGWGYRTYGFFVLTTTLLTSLATLLWQALVSPVGFIAGLSLALTPVTVAWCWINRRETILFSFVFPVPALAIAAISVGFAFFETGQVLGSPFAGVVALVGSGYAWWYVRGGRDWLSRRFSKTKHAPNLRFADLDKDVRGAKPTANPFQKAKEEKERRERDKKIAEMFRNSGYEDDKQP
jgi:membrane associated rhomboid family serine protease